jgi:hypothetical protein
MKTETGKIIKALLKLKEAVRNKFGSAGVNVQDGRDYKNGPYGTDRIHYEIEQIAASINHIPDGGAVIPPLPEDSADGSYTLTASKTGAVVNYAWVEEE